MGILPLDFWGRPDDVWSGMTLREFDDVARGYESKADRELDLVATHAAWIINCWVKKKVKPHKLTGKPDPRPEFHSPEQALAEMSKRADKAQAKGDVMSEIVGAGEEEFRDDGYDPVAFLFDDGDDGDSLDAEALP
jgi:hypothetical protein